MKKDKREKEQSEKTKIRVKKESLAWRELTAYCFSSLQSLDNRTLCQIPQSINNWTIHGLW